MSLALVRDNTRRNHLAQIHMAKAALGWADDHYRDVLATWSREALGTVVTSSAQLLPGQRVAFIAHLNSLQGKTGTAAAKPRAPMLNRQQWYIKKLWEELGAAGKVNDPTPAGLNRFIQSQVGTDTLRMLGTEQARTITEALKSWTRRKST